MASGSGNLYELADLMAAYSGNTGDQVNQSVVADEVMEDGEITEPESAPTVPTAPVVTSNPIAVVAPSASSGIQARNVLCQ